MHRRNGSVCTVILACLAMLFIFYLGHWVPAEGATRAERQQEAEQCVRKALAAEAEGSGVSRQSLLTDALEAMPQHEAARWHSGQVKFRRDWVRFELVPEELADDHRLTRYERARAIAKDTAADQFELAEWCGRRGLDEQRRAHLTRVIALQPNHAEAREALGFLQVDGRWITEAQLDEEQVEARQRDEQRRKWRRPVEKLAARLDHPRESFREAAMKELLTLDADAVPAIEEVLFGDSDQLALVGVEALANIETLESTRALARQSLVAERPRVRREAAKQLKQRDFSHFVPDLLGELQTEVEAERQLFTTSGGRLIHRHVLVNESQDRRQATVLETRYRREDRGGEAEDTLNKALEDVAMNDLRRETALVRTNEQIDRANERVMDALHWAADVDFDEPSQCWRWWDEYNEVYRVGTKQLASVVRSTEVTVEDDIPISLAIASGGSPSPGSFDCLAAGTPVWTSRGLKAIEQIEVGDLVLSQDCETGELAYKPVLATTIRPHSQWTTIRAGRDTISTSGGHLFWSSGQGWTKSRDVTANARLHTVDGSLPVEEVKSGGEGVTYNLVVADFNTYFVGEEKILSHDNTVRRPTNAIVPGLTKNDLNTR